MRILVVGGRQTDAGKTTMTLGLRHALDAVAVKPRAANNYWYDYDTVHRTVTDGGDLVGADAEKLAKSNPTGWSNPAEINPLHRLWQPVDSSTETILGEPGREFVLDRLGTEYILNETADIPDILGTHLDLGDARSIAELSKFNALMRDQYLPFLDSFATEVSSLDSLIIESYGDVALPIHGLTVDVVVSVHPGRIAIYEGRRFLDACRVSSRSPREGRMEPIVSDITTMVDPVATESIPPLRSRTRASPGNIRRAYSDAISAIERAVSACPESDRR